MKPIRTLTLATVLLAGTTAQAGLYPPAAPPGSPFLRVFNATPQAKVSGQVGDKALPDTAALQASSYVFLAPGSTTLKLGGREQALNLQPARCYTAALEATAIQVFEQDCFNSQLKSLVSLYNLVDGRALSLKTADGGTAVIDKVAGNAAGHREVNPLKASLAVYDGASKLGEAKPVALERGKAFSLFVTGDASAPTLVWAGG